MQGRNSRRLGWAALAATIALTAFGAMAALPPVARVPQANLNKTIEAQRRLTLEQPQDAAAWNDLGNLLVLAGRMDDAEAAYRKSVELDPNKESALFNLGLLQQQRGKLREAYKVYKKLIDVAPSHAWAHYQIGAIRERWGSESAAIRSYATAFALDPQLAFPEVNPQIVDNRLATQAMLRAYRNEGSAAPAVPTVFDDPRRIRDLLIPPPAIGAAAKEAESEAAPSAGSSGETSRVLTGKDLSAAGSTAGQATPSGAGGAGPYRSARPGNPQQPPGAGQGFGVPNVGGVRQPIPRGTQEWRRDPNNPSGTAYPGTVINPPSGGYYRPGIPSTGRIGLRVLKDERRDRNG